MSKIPRSSENGSRFSDIMPTFKDWCDLLNYQYSERGQVIPLYYDANGMRSTLSFICEKPSNYSPCYRPFKLRQECRRGKEGTILETDFSPQYAASSLTFVYPPQLRGGVHSLTTLSTLDMKKVDTEGANAVIVTPSTSYLNDLIKRRVLPNASNLSIWIKQKKDETRITARTNGGGILPLEEDALETICDETGLEFVVSPKGAYAQVNGILVIVRQISVSSLDRVFVWDSLTSGRSIFPMYTCS